MNILLVDSDTSVIQALLPALKALPGQEVRVATNGDKAIENAAEMGEVHLLIAEVVMEPMNGFTLRNKLENRNPGMRTIFISEYDLASWSEHIGSAVTLSKPLKTSELLVAVARVARSAGAPQPAPAAVEEKSEPPAPAEASPEPPAQEERKPEPEPPKEPAPQAPEPESPAVEAPAEPPSPAPSAPPAPPPAAVPRAVVPQASAPPAAQPPAEKPPAAQAPAAPKPSPAPVQPAPPQAQPSPAPVPVVPRAVPSPTPPADHAQPAAAPVVPRVSAAPSPPEAAPVPPPPRVVPPPGPEAAGNPDAAALTSRINVPPPRVPPKAVRTAKASAQTPPPRIAHGTPAAGSPPTQAQAAIPAPPEVAPRAPSAFAAPAPTAPATPSAPAEGADDPLVGEVIANYRIVRRIGDGGWGRVYEAVQVSMERAVAMKILSPERQEDPELKKEFIGNASAKANVQHPFILSVYEAGEASGHCYFTQEFVHGSSLEAMAAQGQTLADPMALKVVRIAAEALSHLEQHHIPHTDLLPRSLFVGVDGHPRVANIATLREVQGADVRTRISSLAEVVRTVLPEGRASTPGLEIMMSRMTDTGANGFASWAALLQAVRALEPKVIPADAFKLSAQDVAAIRAVEEAKKRQKRAAILSIAGLAALVLAIIGLVVWKLMPSDASVPDSLVRIPAGAFIYQDGEEKTLPDFWIDEHEVTFGQYGLFLSALERMAKSEPGSEKQFDHPKQPPSKKSHVPNNWAAYYGRAKINAPVMGGIPISLDTPVFGVDWWDARAYAAWKGRRLPTEEEWEKAARGEKGSAYPWGGEPDPAKANTGDDYSDAPGKGADVDRHAYWAPVGAVKGDRSAFGVADMAGNLSEWTGSWEPPQTDPAAIGKYPVIRGGSFRWPAAPLTKRIAEWFPEQSQLWIGFRTASDSAPEE